MDASRYCQLSLRTVPAELAYFSDDFDGDVEATRARLMCNCALGMAGEASEIDETPTSDEIGDGYWYAYVLLHVLGIEDHEPEPSNPTGAHRCAGMVCELVKKHAFHGRAFEDVREPLATWARAYVGALAALDRQTPAQTFAQNVAKLEARYPAGFFERG